MWRWAEQNCDVRYLTVLSREKTESTLDRPQRRQMEALCSGSGLDPLWDWNLTWYTSRPDLTQCFQQTVLVWFPCFYLWICSPFYLVYLQLRSHRGIIPLSKLCCSKTLLALSLASFGLLEMFYFLVKMNDEIQNHLLILLSPLMRILTLVLAAAVIQVERMKGSRSSVVLFLFWTLLVLCSIVPLKVNIQQIIDQGFSSDVGRAASFFICFLLQLIELILTCYSDNRPLPDKRTFIQNSCPEEDASFLSRFFFFWFRSLVIQGYRHPLQAADLWTLRDQDTSIRIMTGLERFWKQQKYKHLTSKSGSWFESWSLSFFQSWSGNPAVKTEKTQLLRKHRKRRDCDLFLLHALGRSFGLYFLCGTLCLLFHDAFMFAVPQVLSALLGFMRDKDAALWKGFLFASLLFLLSCLQSVLHHQYMFHCFTVGMRLKTAIMGLVYRKSLVMSNTTRLQCNLGEIINLVSADTQKLMDFVVYFNSVWIAPLEIALCFYFLWQLLGPPALAGLAAVVLIFPLNGFIAKIRSKLQEVQMKFTDSRIRLMNEILGGVKILKFYSWEEAFLRRVNTLRDGELDALKTSQILYSISLASFNSSSFLIALSVFAVYVLIDEQNVLDAQKIFVSVALINILKSPLSQLPFAMSTTMQAVVSLRRLGNFLSQDELKDDNVERLPHCTDGHSVVIEGGFFSWSSSAPPCLQRINMKVKTGSLVVVVGHVGSGKSSLLSAMLGEMDLKSGLVSVKGSVAYVPQQAWIQNASLKDNVLFGGERMESWYHHVLEACALLPDLDILPAGDGTEIGEKGLNLSGGQKQRVSLARAVYRRSDVYLLDDPLSAVDAHVGQHIFDRVIGPSGLLKDKTRVLVTHGLSFLSKADLILVMEDGHISEMGSYIELMDRKGVFATLIHTFSGNRRKDVFAGSRKSVSRLSMTDFSIDLSQEQLISCDMSSASVKMMEVDDQDLDAEDAGKLTEADKAHTGRVKLQMYREYFRTVGLTFIMTIIFLCAFQQAASLAYNYWLSLWADEVPVNGTQSDHELKLSVFAALGFTQGIAMFGTTLAITLAGIVASRHIHADLLHSILHSPMSFFEVTPSGNLLNRFSKEIDAIDCMIPEGLKMMLGYLFKLLEVCIIVLLATPFTGLVLLPLTCVYIFIQTFYIASSCQLRRLEAVSRSPIYSHFNETVQGASVIRAFGKQQCFILQANHRIDTNQEAYFPRFVATRWLAVNLEFLGNVLVLAAAIFSVYGRDELSPGMVGLTVSHSLQVTGILSWIVRSWTDVENNIVSVERVKEYVELPKEATWTIEGCVLPSNWPTSGAIQFEDYGLQYRKGLDWALKDIYINIEEGEKVGIVGRTGAGKSSLTLGIFRIQEAAKGRILIDGIDIAQIGLHDLRSRITIIPQDPVLFSGSLRMNLDPFETCSDEDLWKALELAHLSSFVSALPQKLNYQCSEGGENLSLGQRQLLCLARALLRKTRILVLDEATAAVDLRTDQLIQSTIRTEFKDCTILTIAHRLNTIMDYTRVIVMDQGSIAEMNSPSQLIHLQGLFYQMCGEAGLV
ncbi:multidrug resistance-associated protein 1-like [Melanotaenia boesemani]|uniref:multidrug resistance-associated protein 1-like n=1 Tax=Melanotaenia boesemani TaxID=1250792 RepID=UPI001C04C367|nr:multidrug resistance-associated protein 1-like [Melanotaenia boesemani]